MVVKLVEFRKNNIELNRKTIHIDDIVYVEHEMISKERKETLIDKVDCVFVDDDLNGTLDNICSIVCRFRNGHDYTILVNDRKVYLCNDEGKTLEVLI